MCFVERHAQLIFFAIGRIGERGVEQARDGKFVWVKGLDFTLASFKRRGRTGGGLFRHNSILYGDGIGLRVRAGLDLLHRNAIAANVFRLPLIFFRGDQRDRFRWTRDTTRGEKEK